MRWELGAAGELLEARGEAQLARQLGILLQALPIAERRGAVRESPDAEPLPPRLLVGAELEQLLGKLAVVVGCEEEIDFVEGQP